MSEFTWRAVEASGKVIEGQLVADSVSLAMKQLRERGLIPLRIQDASANAITSSSISQLGTGHTATNTALGNNPKLKGQGPVKHTDILALTSELSIMLRAGLALDNALRVLIEMSHKPSVAVLLQGVLDEVKGGTPLSKALSNNRELFGDFYINMVRSGEASGQMSKVLERLVEHMERLRALRENIISATIYPAILLLVAVLSLVGMLGFVVPQFEKLFTDMGDALPIPTRIVMTLGQIFTEYGLSILVATVLLALVTNRWLRTAHGRRWWQTALLRLPLVGRLLYKYELTLYARALGTLLGNGVPLLTALHIATETVSNLVLRQALVRVPPIVKDGGKVVDALRATQIFEPLAINLVRVGEETGRIGPMMLELANILNREVETGIKRALIMVEPALILILGLLIASIMVSILLGVFSINDLAV